MQGAVVTRIGSFAFAGCAALEEITLPAALIEVDGSAFVHCDALAYIEVEEGNVRFSDVDGALYRDGGAELVRWPNAKSSNCEMLSSHFSGFKSSLFFSSP